jgi:hypothetical protein
MIDRLLRQIRDLIQEDPGGRGLRSDPAENLCTACAGDFAAACHSLAETADLAVAIVTGFFIPNAQPAAAETDGPLGTLFLARALNSLGARVVLATDDFAATAMQVGLEESGLENDVSLVVLPEFHQSNRLPTDGYWRHLGDSADRLTHLIAIERVGPSHTPASLRSQPGATETTLRQFLDEVPAAHHDRCHNMRGQDITPMGSPAHRLFEYAPRRSPAVTTIGIGDGGNEIGMGKIRWDVLRRNIPRGNYVACRAPTDHLIVSGVSNWGAYGLATGVCLLRGLEPRPEWYDGERERNLLQVMVERGPLVDGATGQPTMTVDGLTFDRYLEPLHRLASLRMS